MHNLILLLFTLSFSTLFAGDPATQPSDAGFYSQSNIQFKLSAEQEGVVNEEVIHAPGADFIKVHFAYLSLPEGAILTVSDPSGQESYQYTSSNRDGHTVDSQLAENGKTSFGAMSINGNTAVIRLTLDQKAGSVDSKHQGVVIQKYLEGQYPNQVTENAAYFLQGNQWYVGKSEGEKSLFLQRNHKPSNPSRIGAMEIWTPGDDHFTKETGLSYLGDTQLEAGKNPEFGRPDVNILSPTITGRGNHMTVDDDNASHQVTSAVTVTKKGLSVYQIVIDGQGNNPGEFTLKAIVSNSVGTTHYQWFWNGFPLDEDSNTLIIDLLCPSAVKVVVTDDSSQATFEKLFLIYSTPNNNPVADFDWSEPSPGEISFTDQSYNNYGTIMGYEWDFGDGRTSTERNPTISFPNGSHSVCLTVFDNACGLKTTHQTIDVGPATPLDLSLQYRDYSRNHHRFITYAYGGVPGYSYRWKVNGVIMFETGPILSFVSSQSYMYVECRVTDSTGASVTEYLDIFIAPPYPSFPDGDRSISFFQND